MKKRKELIFETPAGFSKNQLQATDQYKKNWDNIFSKKPIKKATKRTACKAL